MHEVRKEKASRHQLNLFDVPTVAPKIDTYKKKVIYPHIAELWAGSDMLSKWNEKHAAQHPSFADWETLLPVYYNWLVQREALKQQKLAARENKVATQQKWVPRVWKKTLKTEKHGYNQDRSMRIANVGEN